MHNSHKSVPYWFNTISHTSEKSLDSDLTCEVCIVGAGITGLSTAYELCLQGKQVVVVEDGSLGQSETGNTSAHLSNALDDRYYKIEKMHGAERAALAATSHMHAINRIEEISKKEKINCEFARIPGYLFGDSNSDSEIEKEHDAARRAGIKVTYEQIPKKGKCLVFPDQARFHPLKYLQGLREAIKSNGGKIYSNTQINKIDFNTCELTTANDKKIKAQKIVLATNSPFMPNISMHFKLNPQRSYVIGLKIPKGAIQDALFWDNADPYHYIRIANLNETNDLLIVGGEDHRVGIKPKHDPYQALVKWTKENFDIDKIILEFTWSGQILEPIDYLAYIGQHPKSPHVYMATGDSGNGLTHGVIASQIISDAILNRKNAYASLYEVKRLPWRAITNLLSNASASMIAYVKYLLPQWNKLPNKGEGKISQRGFNKIAIYKDENNKLHKCSGICPHLGAVLNWNPIEKSWDCAAHGSRFDLEGKRLNGPATTNLQCPYKK